MQKLKVDSYEILKSMMEITSPHLGKKFLQIICEELKKLFCADLVFITHALEVKNTKNVKVLYSTLENFVEEFNLDDTPCQLVYNNNVVLIKEDVYLNFKASKKSKKESFLGLPIHNDQGECFGHVAILSYNKRDYHEQMIEIAKIFVLRIEAEAKREILEAENEEIKKKLYLQSIRDDLTKLYNRRYFTLKGEEVFIQVKRNDQVASLIFLDIDNFKTINDACGHEEGDFVLKTLAIVFQQVSRTDADYIFRTGGEEFAIIVMNMNLDQLIFYTKSLQSEVKKQFLNKEYKVTFSVGISNFNDFTSWEEVYKNADDKMYKAKKAGKDCFIC